MHKELLPLPGSLESDLALYEAWAVDLGYSPPSQDDTGRVRALFEWLDATRARLRALEPLLVPSSGQPLDPRGGLVAAFLALEREFSNNGFLNAQGSPLEFELSVHDLDELLMSEPNLSLRTFEVVQDDLEVLVQAISGSDEVSADQLENVFLRLSAVIVSWLAHNPLFGVGQ